MHWHTYEHLIDQLYRFKNNSLNSAVMQFIKLPERILFLKVSRYLAVLAFYNLNRHWLEHYIIFLIRDLRIKNHWYDFISCK